MPPHSPKNLGWDWTFVQSLVLVWFDFFWEEEDNRFPAAYTAWPLMTHGSLVSSSDLLLRVTHAAALKGSVCTLACVQCFFFFFFLTIGLFFQMHFYLTCFIFRPYCQLLDLKSIYISPNSNLNHNILKPKPSTVSLCCIMSTGLIYCWAYWTLAAQPKLLLYSIHIICPLS